MTTQEKELVQLIDKKTEEDVSDELQIHIPASILNGSRKEIQETLKVLEGELPHDIHGHVFVVGPMAHTEEQQKKREVLIYNGDGMVYRFDFLQENSKTVAKVTSKVMKTPCYYADKATQHEPHKKYAFRSHGIARIGRLGSRNQLNTGLVAAGNNLLVTYDGGRPYSIDPNSLDLIRPLGTINEWKGAFELLQRGKVRSTQSIFPTCFTPAHPAYHVKENAIFSVNYSSGFARVFPEAFRSRLNGSLKAAMRGFTHLVRVSQKQGLPKFQRWQIQLTNDEPLIIDQSLHQVAVTENYIILADIAFQMEISQILVPFFLNLSGSRMPALIKRFLTRIFLHPKKQKPYTNLYIINRHALDEKASNCKKCIKKVNAKKVVIPREISHFITGFDDTEDCITIHASHNNAWDVTEWIRAYDKSITGEKLRSDLASLVVGPMDVGFLGRYKIDGKSGALLESKTMCDPNSTWAISLYTYREADAKGNHTAEISGKIEDIYWLSWGFSATVIPNRIYDSYKDYRYRGVPIENLKESGKFVDKPVQLLRLNTDSMEIEDAYKFEPGYFVSSPQFIPVDEEESVTTGVPDNDEVSGETAQNEKASKAKQLSTSGYIVCTVYKDVMPSQDEIWIFDAGNLAKPICKLGHENLDFHLTVHSAWLSSLGDSLDPEALKDARRASVRDEYEAYVKENFPDLADLFEREVYEKYAAQEMVAPDDAQ